LPVSKKFKSLTAGELQPANVAALEDELSELWRAAAEDPGTEHPVMRASVLTLVAFVESEDEGRETFNLISRVIAQNPCRAILMVAEPREHPEGFRLSVIYPRRVQGRSAANRSMCGPGAKR